MKFPPLSISSNVACGCHHTALKSFCKSACKVLTPMPFQMTPLGVVAAISPVWPAFTSALTEAGIEWATIRDFLRGDDVDQDDELVVLFPDFKV